MPTFRFNKVSDVARNVKALLNKENGDTREAGPDAEQQRRQDLKRRLKAKRHELSQLRRMRSAVTEIEQTKVKSKERKKTLQ